MQQDKPPEPPGADHIAALARPRTLEDFAGLWKFRRTVHHANGDRADVRGETLFTPCEGGMLQADSGEMRMPGRRPISVFQRCLWTPDLHVRFEDGREFHHVPARGGRAYHVCPPDDYWVEYDFAGWPEWSTIWTVRGPRKDYRMDTRYRRVPEAAAKT